MTRKQQAGQWTAYHNYIEHIGKKNRIFFNLRLYTFVLRLWNVCESNGNGYIVATLLLMIINRYFDLKTQNSIYTANSINRILQHRRTSTHWFGVKLRQNIKENITTGRRRKSIKKNEERLISSKIVIKL